MNEPTSSRNDHRSDVRETDGSQTRQGPSVDLRTDDPSPSGSTLDAEVEDAEVEDVEVEDVEVEDAEVEDTAIADPSAAGDPAVGEPQVEDAEGGESDEAGVDLESLAAADPRSKAELIGAVLDLEADRDQYLDDLRRARAEFENYRRRVTREAAAQRRAGTAVAVSSLLDVLDDLDRTLDAAESTSDEGLKKGIELVASKLVQALTSLGVERIDAVGEAFDPNQHEAVQQVPADGPTDQPVVAQVLRPGYRLEDRVLRAAMVVVQG